MDRKQVEALLHFIREEGYHMSSMERRTEPPFVEGDSPLRLEKKKKKRYYHPQLVDDIMALEGVHYAEEII